MASPSQQFTDMVRVLGQIRLQREIAMRHRYAGEAQHVESHMGEVSRSVIGLERRCWRCEAITRHTTIEYRDERGRTWEEIVCSPCGQKRLVCVK